MDAADWPFLDELETYVALNQSLNICIASPEYPLPGIGTSSGVGSAAESLAHGLTQQGHQVTIVTLTRQSMPSIVEDKVAVHYITSGQIHWYIYKIPWLGKLLSLPVREIEQSRAFAGGIGSLHHQQPFDLIEATESGSLILSLRRGWPPLIVRLHGEEHTFLRHTPGAAMPMAQRLSRWLQKIALRRAAALIAPSHAHASSIAAELNCAVDYIRVIPHALNPIWRLWREQLRDTPREPVILFVGRLESLKGIVDGLQCFERIAAVVSSVQLVVIGPNHPTIPAIALTTQIDQSGLTERVHMLGQLSHEQLAGWYARAQILIMPSYYETFGLVALEAMTFGVPIAAYRSGALPEVIIEGKTGMLIAAGDVEALAQATIALLQDEPRRLMMSVAAERHAASFTTEEYIQNSLAVYYTVS